jgi:predicted transcriptional regulator
MAGATSSIRVSAATRKRVGQLASHLHVSSQEEVLELALRRLEREVFWEGFDQEACAYLEAHPGEQAERASYSGTALDRSRRAR